MDGAGCTVLCLKHHRVPEKQWDSSFRTNDNSKQTLKSASHNDSHTSRTRPRGALTPSDTAPAAAVSSRIQQILTESFSLSLGLSLYT